MTSPILALRAAVLTAVQGDAALAALMGGSVRLHDEAPRAAEPVYAVFGEVTASDASTGTERAHEQRLTLVVWAREGSARSGLEAAERLAALLDDAPLALAGHRALCQRYFAKTFPPAVAPAQNAGLSGALVAHAVVANAIPVLRWAFPVPMRAVPVLAFYNPSAANGQWSAGGVAAVASATLPATRDAAYIATAAAPTIAAGTLAAVHATADAEL
jgi:hypothetical protein